MTTKLKPKIKKSHRTFGCSRHRGLDITKTMTLEELSLKYPKLVNVLLEKGMHCIGCHMASFETIEQGAIAHGLNPDALVKELNSKLNKKK